MRDRHQPDQEILPDPGPIKPKGGHTFPLGHVPLNDFLRRLLESLAGDPTHINRPILDKASDFGCGVIASDTLSYDVITGAHSHGRTAMPSNTATNSSWDEPRRC